MKNFLLPFFLSSLLLASTSSFAQTARAELVQRIAVAQGLEEMFEQQLAAQQESMKSYASKLFQQAVSDAGGQANAQQTAAFERFVAKLAVLFSSKEITAAWTAAYGKDLSDQDLKQILKYYQSPIGKKDVSASKAAMIAYSGWINQEAQNRVTPILRSLVQELQATEK